MTDNALKIIKDELARIDEARAKATQGEWAGRESSDEIKLPYVDVKPGYFFWPQFVKNEVTAMLKVNPNFKHDSEFIALAANEITNLTKALNVAVEQLDKIVGTREYSINKEPHKFIADETLAIIANILSGGKDGK